LSLLTTEWENPMKMRLLRSFLVVLTLALGSQAQAQLLFSGGEDIDFLCNSGGTCVTSTSSPYYRSGWARSAYEVGGAPSDPPLNRFATPVFSAGATIWIHAQFCICGGSAPTTANDQMLRVFDSSGNPTLMLRGTGTNGQLVISSRTSAGVFTDLVTCSSAFNASLTQLDFYINYGTSGEVTLYNNSAQVCDYTGNVTNGDGATTLNQVEFSDPYNSEYANWSEVIIATSDTRAMARFSAYTVNNGNTTGFSGTNICSSIWNAASYNDSSFGYTGSNNVLQECTVNSPIPAGSYSVLALVMSARALVGASGPQHFDFVTRVAGTDYTSSDVAPTNSFSNFTNYIQNVNPSSSNPWSVSDFQASGFNVGEESKP